MSIKNKFFRVACLVMLGAVSTLSAFQSAFSQITITQSDMPSPGDTIRKSLNITTGGIDYTVTGENFSWDYSTLQPLAQTVDTFVTVSSVPFLYQWVFFSVANVAQKFPDLDTIPGLTVVDPYRFFYKSSSKYSDVGYAATLGGIPLPVRLNPEDRLYKLPLNYGNIDSSNASGHFGFQGVGYIGLERKRVNQVDGWGALVTPMGTFDVLRLKSTVYETDSVFIDSLNYGTTIERNYTEYSWLANGWKAPVLKVTVEGPVVQVAYIDSVFNPTVNIENVRYYPPSISISPNPVHDMAIISLDLNESRQLSITLINIAGEEVLRVYEGNLPAGRNFFTLKPSAGNLRQGTYLLQVKTDFNITSKKIIVQ